MTVRVSERRRSPEFAVLLGLAWLVVVAQLLADHWAETAQTLSDMDDAMRLVQVREFLAGASWFDLHEVRLGPPDGYDTHWSRLIDAGLAGLFVLFRRFTDAVFAERLMRTVWPMLWLIPAMAGRVRERLPGCAASSGKFSGASATFTSAVSSDRPLKRRSSLAPGLAGPPALT